MSLLHTRWRNSEVQGVFCNWYPPKKLKYGKPRLGESMLTQIGLDTPNLAQINFFVLGTFRGGVPVRKNTLYVCYIVICVILNCVSANFFNKFPTLRNPELLELTPEFTSNLERFVIQIGNELRFGVSKVNLFFYTLIKMENLHLTTALHCTGALVSNGNRFVGTLYLYLCLCLCLCLYLYLFCVCNCICIVFVFATLR